MLSVLSVFSVSISAVDLDSSRLATTRVLGAGTPCDGTLREIPKNDSDVGSDIVSLGHDLRSKQPLKRPWRKPFNVNDDTIFVTIRSPMSMTPLTNSRQTAGPNSNAIRAKMETENMSILGVCVGTFFTFPYVF